MVDLGFNLKKGYGLSNADDVRSVVKNATKDVNMSESKDKTIMTSDELREKKAKEIINDKKSKVVPTAKTQNQTVNNKSSINVNTNKIGGDILNKNVMVGGVDNIKPETIKNNEGNVVKETGIKVNNIGNDFGGGIEGITKDLSGIGGTTISPEQMNKKKEEINQRRELTKEAMNYVGEFANSVNDSILNGEEDRLTIENIRKAFPEFNSLDDKQLGDLTRDIYNANKLGNEFNLYNYALKHPELYMEFDNSEQIGNVGRADYLDAMFNSSDASSKPGLFKIMTLGLAPNELGILDTTTLDETDIGDEGKTFMNNAWKSVWNAVALTYNFLSHPLESAKMLGGSVLGMGADYALKKVAEEKGVSKDEFVQGLINNMGDGSSLSDKITRLLVNGGEMGGLMKDFFKTNYGSAEGFLNYLYSDPAGAISDIVSIGELGVGLAGKMGLIEKGAVKSINKTLGWIDPYEATGRALLGYENVPGALGVATRAEGKVLRGVTKGIRKASGNVVDFVLNKMTGIGEEQRKFIKENPDLAMKYIKGEETAQDIAERIMNKFNELGDEKKAEGERYNLIRNNGNLSVKIGDTINKIKDVFGELGIKISDGKLKFNDISYSDAQQKALQNVYKYVDSLSKRGDEASVSDVWRVRQLIDNAINWEGNSKMGLDAEVMNTIKNMRNKVDDALKSQIEGFKDIDNNYSRIINAIKELKKDWFNKDGSLKDNALSKIRNLTNKGNEKKLERLEKYLPGIGEDARALGVAEVIDKATKQNVGQYLQQGLVGGGLVGLGALMTGGVSTAGVITALGMMGVLTPKNFVKVLATMGKVGEKVSNSAVGKGAKMVGLGVDWIKSVGEKIIKGEKLSQSQIDAIEKLTSENMRDFMANPEKYVDYEYDRAQKSAYLGHESTEKKLLEEEIKKLDKKYEKKMKDIGFVRDVEDGILRDSEGYSLLKEKLYNWRKDAGDTTRQHEFFHSVFSVVDDKTYRYVLDEAKKYLNLDENKLGSKADEVADEWLAESFGVYIRRKEIKSGEIRLKGNRLERFNSKIRDLFQRAYEWIQGYIVDRETIDKLFDEVYGGVKLNDAGKVDLAEKLGINEKNNKKLGGVEKNKGLRYKKGWHGGGDFDEFDLRHSREGEGGEAHGYGVYVTENKERAKAYGNLYRNNKYGYYGFGDAKQFVSYKGMKKPEIDGKYAYLVRKVIDGMMEKDEAYPYYDAESQIAKQKRVINNEKNVMMGRMSGEEFNNYKKEKDAELKFLDSLDPKDFKVENPKRNLYEVDAPNKVKRDTPTGSNYLEEKGEIPALAKNDFAFAVADKLGDEAYKGFLKELGRKRNLLGEDIYRALSKVLGSTKEASMFLKELGYDGIHYIGELDGSSYVLFNDKGLPIKDKIRYKKAGKSENFDYNKNVGVTRSEKLLSKTKKPISELGLGKKVNSVVGDGADGNSTLGDVRQSKSANLGQNLDNSGLFGGNKKIKLGDKEIITDELNGKSKFSGKKVSLQPENRRYYTNLVNAIRRWEDGIGLKDNALVGRTERGRNVFLSSDRLGHIFEDHGAFYLENFIEAINSRKNQFWAKDYEKGGLRVKGKPRIELEVPGSDEVFLVSFGTNKKNPESARSYFITSFRESNPSTLDSDRVRLKRVFHGSPADFEKFDSSHMGEGEGAQAHGWGHYVAVEERTGRHYASMGKDEGIYKGMDGGALNSKYGEMVRKNKDYTKEMGEINVAKGIMEDMKSGKSFEESKKDLKNKLNEWYKQSPSNKLWEKSLEAIDDIKEGDIEIKRGHNLYEVEIPDPIKKDTPTGSNYLEEKGELSKKELEKFGRKIENELGFEIRSLDSATMDDVKRMGDKLGWGDDFVNEVKSDLKEWNDGDIEGAIVKELKYGVSDFDKFLKDNGFFYLNDRNIYNGGKLYETISKLLGSDKKASKFLESLGYDGIHYYGGRDGEAYVIFGDNNMDIRDHIRYKKENKGLEAKEKTNTNNFKNWFGNSIAKADNGEPKVLYHGTVGKFDAFDRNRIGSNAQRLGPGFYFTNDKKVAKEYTTRLNSLGEKVKYAGDEPSVKEVYVSLQNPLKFNEELVDEKAIKKVLMEGDKDYYFNNTIPFKVNGNEFLGRKWTREEVEKLPKSKKVDLMLEYIKRGINERDYGRLNEELLGETTRAFNNKGDVLDYLMKYTGKDGVYAKDWKGLEQYVTWNEGQQKYTNNVGTFDKNNTDMRYKKDRLRPGEIDYGNKGLNYKGEISRGKVKEYLSKAMNKESLIKNIGRYDEAKESFDADLKKWAKELGGKEVTTSIKMRNMDGTLREDGIERILEKQKKYGKIGGVKDIVRGTIIVEGKEGLKKALDMFYGDGRGVDDKYEFIGVNDMGYRDLSFNYWTKNGIPSEVQINVPEMMVAKEGENLVKWGFISRKKYDSIVEKAGIEGGKGHKMYEEWRKLKEKLDDEKDYSKKREIMGKMGEIEKNSRKYYKKFEDLIK